MYAPGAVAAKPGLASSALLSMEAAAAAAAAAPSPAPAVTTRSFQVSPLPARRFRAPSRSFNFSAPHGPRGPKIVGALERGGSRPHGYRTPRGDGSVGGGRCNGLRGGGGSLGAAAGS
ncbi:hypothetical protein MC885_007696 [Smutsia gigantea]|nr:hypothetical protein MC885_007696 [Smutsia gigantea]